MQGGLSARRETHRFTPQQAQLLDYAPRNAANRMDRHRRP
jgi:hypothetical protein